MSRIKGFIDQKIPKTLKVSDKQNIGIGGFTLDVRIKEEVVQTLNAPTTPLEDGSFANDHIVVNPLTLQIEGEVSEIKFEQNLISDIYKRTIGAVGVVNRYLPTRTQSQVNRVVALANDTRASIRKAEALVKDGRQLLDLFGNKASKKSTQELFIDQMEKLQLGKQLISIQMPFRVYDNMVVTSFTVYKDNISGNYLNYKITAQQVRFAEVVYSEATNFRPNPSTGVDGQTDGPSQKGLNEGGTPNRSFASFLRSTFQ
jgi:hypothetical protein